MLPYAHEPTLSNIWQWGGQQGDVKPEEVPVPRPAGGTSGHQTDRPAAEGTSSRELCMEASWSGSQAVGVSSSLHSKEASASHQQAALGEMPLGRATNSLQLAGEEAEGERAQAVKLQGRGRRVRQPAAARRPLPNVVATPSWCVRRVLERGEPGRGHTQQCMHRLASRQCTLQGSTSCMQHGLQAHMG